MANLLRVGRNAMATQQYRHRNEPRLIAIRRLRTRLVDGHIATFGGTRRRQGIAGERNQTTPARNQTGKSMLRPIDEALRSGQEQAAVPDFFKFSTRHQLRMWRGRMQHERGVVLDLPKQQEAAITQPCDSGQADACELFPMCRARTDLQSEIAGAAKHRTDADCAFPATVAELVGLGVHAMKAQEQSQGSKPEICGMGISILDRHLILNPSRLPAAYDVPSHAFPIIDGAAPRR
ncbi:hypothetical protein ABIF41_004886 [Bradyrhizobium japonicum]|uniref:Uncharacterized protein n=1 Tax=Bradyrhizobium diazoefficiens TaxID=1355477 RepID=A0A810BKH4_9BRAD|nr:hypothetical protein XF8B_65850 [Bradyrhizobium diazoefficiens]BCF37572.1 hypothetical protein XF15B_66430 [Bradyrhizobium diazoefficiens]BCF46250.1 hypothetical protein XF16B_67400 [Bradyrhizobium diazoefficiens]BCF72403.1 hypothetical protein XF19B_67560 [Bradyrhizobium diazoefficiens]